MKPFPASAQDPPWGGLPRKRFGQHFLVQPQIARRIVARARLQAGDPVLEIGPGRGALTKILAEAAGELWAIEVDRNLAQRLQERFATRPDVHVIEGDVLQIDLPPLLRAAAPVVVVANLPYNISTPVLMKLLETPDLFARLILMLQREVAERLAAAPGTKVYGMLSVMVQLVADVRTAFRVSPGAFVPRPKVESAVVVIEPRRPIPLSPAERAAVRRVAQAAFSQRRKQLCNSLATMCGDPQALLRQLDIDPRRRPETLPPQDFVRLAEALTQFSIPSPQSPASSLQPPASSVQRPSHARTSRG